MGKESSFTERVDVVYRPVWSNSENWPDGFIGRVVTQATGFLTAEERKLYEANPEHMLGVDSD